MNRLLLFVSKVFIPAFRYGNRKIKEMGFNRGELVNGLKTVAQDFKSRVIQKREDWKVIGTKVKEGLYE